VIAGIWPLTSLRNAEFMKNDLRVSVPDQILRRMQKADTPELARAEGVRIAQEMLRAARSMGYGGIQGVQVSAPFGRYAVAAEVIAELLPQTAPQAAEQTVMEDLKIEGLRVGNV